MGLPPFFFTLINLENMRFSDELLMAVTGDQIDSFKSLLEKDNIDLRQVDIDGRTLLHWAAQEDACDIAEWLLNEACDLIDQKDESSQTPLRIAAGEGHVLTVGVLLEHGARVNPPGQPESESALKIAQLYGHETIVMMLEFARDRPGLLEEMRKRSPE